jgi:hypothetical protein
MLAVPFHGSAEMTDRPHPRNRPWTPEEMRRLLEAGPRGSITPKQALQLSIEFERTTEAIKTKLKLLVPYLVMDGEDGREIDEGAFANAMMAAVEAGLEHPPMIGVDTRPCTKRPIFIENLKNNQNLSR